MERCEFQTEMVIQVRSIPENELVNEYGLPVAERGWYVSIELLAPVSSVLDGDQLLLLSDAFIPQQFPQLAWVVNPVMNIVTRKSG